MNPLQVFFCNGLVLIIPILVWNGIFSSRLPPIFKPNTFDCNMSKFILIGEKAFRFPIFLMPVAMQINISTSMGKVGAGVYFLGILVYFLSWLLLMLNSGSRWSTSILGFCAPAYTPLIWLVGISLMVDSYFFDITYSKGHFIIPAMCFSFFHILHTTEVYNRESKS